MAWTSSHGQVSKEAKAFRLCRASRDEGAHRICGTARHSRSLVAEAAIASFLSPDAPERQEAAIAKRLDQADRRTARLERDVGIAVEMLAVFVRFWLTTNPPLPEPAMAAARVQAGERYDAFVAAVGRRLAKGPLLRNEIPEDANSPTQDAGG